MAFTIVAIADIHAAERNPVGCPGRCGAMAEQLLSRAVERINGELKPDVTLFLGDLLDDGRGPRGATALRRLRGIIDRLQSPVVVIPGNHDGDADAFYREMPRPAAVVEVGGVRLLPFLDPEEPDYNARRTTADLERMTAARDGFAGPIIALQHVPLLPPGYGASPYRLTNAPAAIDAMRAAAITLAISGHFHAGEPVLHHQSSAFVVTPALCEAPFPFLSITLDGKTITVNRHELGLPG